MTLALSDADAARARLLLDELQALLAERPAVPPPEPTIAAEPAPAAPPATPRPRELIAQDYADAAARLACDVPAVRAVCAIESNGRGFGDDGRPVLLFEPHVFSRLTAHRFDATHGGVSYPKWGAKPYPKGQAARWDQMLYAARLDHDAAYQAASYGLFQIMGFNFRTCGFASIDDFVAAMQAGEREQLLAFVAYVQTNRLDDELREHRWADFAARYNGPGFKANAYDTKLAAAHVKWSALA